MDNFKFSDRMTWVKFWWSNIILIAAYFVNHEFSTSGSFGAKFSVSTYQTTSAKTQIACFGQNINV